MEYAEKQEKIEQSHFTEELPKWDELRRRAKAYRRTDGWDQQAEDAQAIRKNDLPLKSMAAKPDWKGAYYVDNWLFKSIKWLVSMQTGSDVAIDVRGYDGIMSHPQELLEMEVNFANSQFQFMDVIEDCLYDRYYTGLGVCRGYWNAKDIRPQYLTGTPHLEYINPFTIYLDPAARTRDKADARYIFHEEHFDLREFKRRYPKYATKLTESINEDRPEATGMIRIITMQYRQKMDVEKIYIEDAEAGVSQDFLVDEWIEYIASLRNDPKIQELYAQAQVPETYDDWLMEGGFLPEKVRMLGPLESEEDAVFQAIYVADADIVLEKPRYIGKRFTYFFLIGHHNPDSAYPFGLAHYMKGALNLSIIVMTVLAIQAVKQHKIEKMIQEDSLVNQPEYQEKGYELGVNPIVRDEWQRSHPHSKAVEYLPLPDFPVSLQMLNEQLTNIQKTTSGAVDANMGVAQYSGQSGIQIAQLQAASRTYNKEDFEGYRRIIQTINTWLMEAISQYRNYPHAIAGLDEQNRQTQMDIATNAGNRLNAANYYIDVTIQDNAEIVKQIEQQVAMQLYQMGLSSDIDLLSKLDIPNPERWADRAAEYRGDKQIIEAVKQYPELGQLIQNFIANLQNQGQPKTADAISVEGNNATQLGTEKSPG